MNPNSNTTPNEHWVLTKHKAFLKESLKEITGAMDIDFCAENEILLKNDDLDTREHELLTEQSNKAAYLFLHPTAKL